MRKMIASVYQKVYDPSKRKFYYYNTVTKKATWKKPVGLGSTDLELTPRSMAAAGIEPPRKPPRFTAETLSDEEAAIHIQQAFRAKRVGI